MTILSKACKPGNFESHNSLKLSFMNIQGLRSNFVDCKSFLESSSPDVLALCETNLDDSVDSGNFCVRSYLPLIRKDSCMGLISSKICRFLLMFLTGFIWLSVLLLFRLLLLLSPSSSLCTVFDSTPSNIDEVPATNVLVFGDFNVHHKDWLTFSRGTDRPGELCYHFSISNDLTQMVNFPTWIPDYDSNSPALLDLFLSSDASICSAMAFPPLGISDHVSVSIDFPSNS